MHKPVGLKTRATHPLARQFVAVCNGFRKNTKGEWTESLTDVNNLVFNGHVPGRVLAAKSFREPGRRVAVSRAANTLIVEFIDDYQYALAELVFNEVGNTASITFHHH